MDMNLCQLSGPCSVWHDMLRMSDFSRYSLPMLPCLVTRLLPFFLPVPYFPTFFHREIFFAVFFWIRFPSKILYRIFVHHAYLYLR